jgi:hypothetical protein
MEMIVFGAQVIKPLFTPMKKRLTRVAPLQLGKVLAVLYGFFSLLVVPFVVLASLLGAKAGHHNPAFPANIILVVLIPILYAVLGFVGGVIAAAIYNLVASWTGGIEFSFENADEEQTLET